MKQGYDDRGGGGDRASFLLNNSASPFIGCMPGIPYDGPVLMTINVSLSAICRPGEDLSCASIVFAGEEEEEEEEKIISPKEHWGFSHHLI